MGGTAVWPGTGGLNMASMVGRRAAPKGVDKKSLGRSDSWTIRQRVLGMKETSVPLINDGIDPPVRKPTTSLVKELQLKSVSG
jgi:hypothetical protein